MARECSPLRYPGGKQSLEGLTVALLHANKLQQGDYVEPFAGGGGLALSLLYAGVVADIHLNDIDPGIWAFWHSVLAENKKFTRLIETTPINLSEWHRQKEINLRADLSDPIKLGFSTFFLNRTNRSGIIKGAGVIGGLAQNGNYLIDCRFNRVELIRRVARIERYRERIHLSRMDAIKFLQTSKRKLKERSLIFIDPPYFKKGSKLYTSFYTPEDHAALSKVVLETGLPWVVTYDSVPEIQKLYRTRRQFHFGINYSVSTKRVGTELLIVSKGLKIPSQLRAEFSLVSSASIVET